MRLLLFIMCQPRGCATVTWPLSYQRIGEASLDNDTLTTPPRAGIWLGIADIAFQDRSVKATSGIHLHEWTVGDYSRRAARHPDK